MDWSLLVIVKRVGGIKIRFRRNLFSNPWTTVADIVARVAGLISQRVEVTEGGTEITERVFDYTVLLDSLSNQ